MKTTLLPAILASCVILATPLATWSVDTPSDEARVIRQAAITADLTAVAASSAGYPPSSIEVTPAAHVLTVVVVNSRLNTGDAQARKAEAVRIAHAVEGRITGNADFAAVFAIHVNYVVREGEHSKVIQGIDFLRAADGRFTLHVT